MDSREIEAQIKGLLGLQLGSEAAESTVPPGAYPRHKNRYCSVQYSVRLNFKIGSDN